MYMCTYTWVYIHPYTHTYIALHKITWHCLACVTLHFTYIYVYTHTYKYAYTCAYKYTWAHLPVYEYTYMSWITHWTKMLNLRLGNPCFLGSPVSSLRTQQSGRCTWREQSLVNRNIPELWIDPRALTKDKDKEGDKGCSALSNTNPKIKEAPVISGRSHVNKLT